ncbi:hypothetical protein RN001_004502 [Aquatica leii]|uniref:G-protein coupled receptors family 1 profile domain-containing protein n=1 Tax=Aquatica leii TaxID=1421715 RepID=A0AAN7PBP9_9COLE|nr:hypothetical protein RN001_004502 [Aquatica leii]
MPYLLTINNVTFSKLNPIQIEELSTPKKLNYYRQDSSITNQNIDVLPDFRTQLRNLPYQFASQKPEISGELLSANECSNINEPESLNNIIKDDEKKDPSFRCYQVDNKTKIDKVNKLLTEVGEPPIKVKKVSSDTEYQEVLGSVVNKITNNNNFAVVVAFFVCWAPFHTQRLVAIYGTIPIDHEDRQKFFKIYEIVTYTSGILYYFSTTINPVLYNIMSNKFREAFKETFTRCCGLVFFKTKHPKRTYSILTRSFRRGADSCTDSSARDEASIQTNITSTLESSHNSINYRRHSSRRKRQDVQFESCLKFTPNDENVTFVINRPVTKTSPSFKKNACWNILSKPKSPPTIEPKTFRGKCTTNTTKINAVKNLCAPPCDISNSGLRDNNAVLEYELCNYPLTVEISVMADDEGSSEGAHSVIKEYWCKKCKNKIKNAFIKRIKCESVYHKSCAKILLSNNKQITTLNETELICDRHTEDDLDNEEIESNVESQIIQLRQENKMLHQVIKYLKLEINNLKLQIKQHVQQKGFVDIVSEDKFEILNYFIEFKNQINSKFDDIYKVMKLNNESQTQCSTATKITNTLSMNYAKAVTSKNTEKIIVTPINEQKCVDTTIEVINKVDPVKLAVGIENVKNIKNFQKWIRFRRLKFNYRNKKQARVFIMEKNEATTAQDRAQATLDEAVQVAVKAVIEHQQTSARNALESPSVSFKTNEISALLRDFSGHDDDVTGWLQRLDAVQRTYVVSDDIMQLISVGKLSGQAKT